MSLPHCSEPQDGVSRVTLADVAKLRGGSLVAGPESTDNAVYVAIARRNQPTGGYGWSLVQAKAQDGVAYLDVSWETPGKDQMLIQQITHPCMVVGFDGADLNRVQVSDADGIVGELTL